MTDQQDNPDAGDESADGPRRDPLSDSGVMDAPAEGGTPDEDAEMEAEFLAEVEVEDESGDAIGEIQEAIGEGDVDGESAIEGFEEAAAAAAPRKAPPRKKKDNSLKATAVPLLGTVGVLLLWPALWGFSHITGISRSGKDGANAMAWIMFLLATPTGAILLAAAVWFYMQIKKDKAEEAAKKIAR